MRDWCTLSPDGFLGVEWSMSCMSHDGRYDTGETAGDKIKADLDLALDVWATASLADKAWKTAVIRVYSIIMLIGTNIGGWYFWLREKHG